MHQPLIYNNMESESRAFRKANGGSILLEENKDVERLWKAETSRKPEQ